MAASPALCARCPAIVGAPGSQLQVVITISSSNHHHNKNTRIITIVGRTFSFGENDLVAFLSLEWAPLALII